VQHVTGVLDEGDVVLVDEGRVVEAGVLLVASVEQLQLAVVGG
jgi:hypothetical protein